jgi:hypothetical protein
MQRGRSGGFLILLLIQLLTSSQRYLVTRSHYYKGSNHFPTAVFFLSFPQVSEQKPRHFTSVVKSQ